MGSIVKENGGDFKVLDEGTHLSICDAVIDVGLQNTPWGSQQEHVHMRFEVPAERVQFIRDGEELDEPMTIWARFNKTLNRKATLRKDLESWRGRKFTEEELQGFELFNVAGKPCLITVVHNQTADRTYANISGIAQVMKGQEIPAQELDAILFSPDDTDQYKDVPEWLQKKFDERVEIEEVPDNVIDMPQGEPVADDLPEDDIPF